MQEEPARQGHGGADCAKCAATDSDYIWVDDRWRVRALGRPSGLPAVVVLETRHHYDMGDLSNLLAAELGVLTVRLERAIRSIDGVARVHVNRWGDGSEHLHVFFLARPQGMLQLRGTFLSMWDDILPPIPESQWRENLAFIAAWLSEYGGEAVAEPPPMRWDRESAEPGDSSTDGSGDTYGSSALTPGTTPDEPGDGHPDESGTSEPEGTRAQDSDSYGPSGDTESGEGEPAPGDGTPGVRAPGQARPDHSGPEHSGPNQGRPDHSGPDHGAPDQARRDHGGPDRVGPGNPASVRDVPSIWEPREPAATGHLNESGPGPGPDHSVSGNLETGHGPPSRLGAERSAFDAAAPPPRSRFSRLAGAFPPHPDRGGSARPDRDGSVSGYRDGAPSPHRAGSPRGVPPSRGAASPGPSPAGEPPSPGTPGEAITPPAGTEPQNPAQPHGAQPHGAPPPHGGPPRYGRAAEAMPYRPPTPATYGTPRSPGDAPAPDAPEPEAPDGMRDQPMRVKGVASVVPRMPITRDGAETPQETDRRPPWRRGGSGGQRPSAAS
ncbi:MAG: hypothetical protein ACRDTU_09600 [Micromonosporaceae bacterium]